MRHFIRKDKGNALIMGALSFAVLAAFGVLTIDIGRIMVTKNQLQNGADAAALAGASVFCEGGANATEAGAKARAQLIGQGNSALGLGNAQPIKINPDADITVTKDDQTGTNTVEVTTHSTTAQYFLGLAQLAGKLGGNAAKSTAVHAVAAAACGATCGVSCVKPWSPPDRWDDVTPIAGYDKAGKNLKKWNNDGVYDHEDFTDVNGNGLYDQGEPFTDGNNNGKYDQEFYSPTLTGYIPDPIPGNSLAPQGDLGLEITLHFQNGGGNTLPAPGQYQSIDLPPLNRGTPEKGGSVYRDNIANCNASDVWPGDWLLLEPGGKVGPTNQGMRELIGKDPGAYWDPITQSVQGSDPKYSISPRIVLIPMYDPRIAVESGRNAIQVVKVAAFFMEQMTGNSEVQGRFLKVRAPGEPCVAVGGGGGGGISFTYALSLIK